MECDKCRNKALKTAAEVQGVTSVSLEGNDKDSICVIGDDVDTICLANQLKKKFNSVTILSVEEVKKKSDAEMKKDEEKKKEEEKKKMIEACRSVLQGTCIKCHDLTCNGKCDKCPKCESLKCDGKHCVTICFKCEDSKCDGKCKANCCNCDNKKCDGCTLPAPPNKPPTPTEKPPTPPQKTPTPPIQQCPQWCTCPKCYVPYRPYPPCSNAYPPYFKVVYEQNPETCSIM